MKIILLDDIDKLGLAGDVVNVARGFARNYLLPKKRAILATSGTQREIEKIKKLAAEKRLKEHESLLEVAKQLEGETLLFKRKTDERGHLFGSVSEIDIARHFEQKGVSIHRNMVALESHIKEIGDYDVSLNFSKKVQVPIKVVVESEDIQYAPTPETEKQEQEDL